MSFVHETAVVDPGAHIGADTKIWHFAHVMKGAWIGDRGSVGQGCYIGNVRIGHGCRIQNHVSVFDGVTLEDDVFLGPCCVFTNVKHPRAHVARKDAFDRTLVCRGASIGANATVVCGVTIGEYALIGAGSVVTHDVAPFALITGTPGQRTGWVCRCGETLPANLVCARCGDVYLEDHGGLAVAIASSALPSGAASPNGDAVSIEGSESQLVTRDR